MGVGVGAFVGPGVGVAVGTGVGVAVGAGVGVGVGVAVGTGVGVATGRSCFARDASDFSFPSIQTVKASEVTRSLPFFTMQRNCHSCILSVIVKYSCWIFAVFFSVKSRKVLPWSSLTCHWKVQPDLFTSARNL